jgi:predicted RNase H-like HicB family nuclease
VKFTVVIEKAENNYSVYVPDLPGCVATAATLEEARQMIQEAIEFHLEGMLQHGEAIPPATTQCDEIEVDVQQLAAMPPAPINP